MSEPFDVVIVGAGFCGLAAGAALQEHGVRSFAILEQGQDVGHFWSQTYDRLHLHSPWHGICRDADLNARYPMYKTRDQLIDYFREYARRFGLYDHLHGGRRVSRIRRDRDARTTDAWQIDTNEGSYRARFLIVATAVNRRAKVAAIPGREEFGGRILHSSEYRNPTAFRGEKVLVVGSGNSAAEIALDLAEGGASPSLWVRGPRHFIPHRRMTWLFKFSRMMGVISEAALDRAHAIAYDSPPFWKEIRKRDALVSRLGVDLSRFGIRRPQRGPNEETFTTGRIPAFDVGAIEAIRRGVIRVVDGNVRPLLAFGPKGVHLGDSVEQFDSVILATGFEPRLEEFLDEPDLLGPVRWLTKGPLTDGRSRSRIAPTAFFPGFDLSVSGGLSLGRWGWEAGQRVSEEL